MQMFKLDRLLMLSSQSRESLSTHGGKCYPYGVTLACCTLVTGVATLVIDKIDLANIVMLYLLSVLLISVWQGKKAGVFSAVISVLFFDVFFVPPRFSILVEDFQYIITFAVMLVTALVTGQLAAGLKERALEAMDREANIKALYAAAGKLGASVSLNEVHQSVSEFVLKHFGAVSVLYLNTGEKGIFRCVPEVAPAFVNMQILQSSHFIGDTVKNSTLSGNNLLSIYIPLKGVRDTLGVMVVNGVFDDSEITDGVVAQLEGLASLVAIAVERLHFQQAAQSSDIQIELERLRNAILSSLSHDLRTPLTALVGLGESLLISSPLLQGPQVDLARQINEQSRRISELVSDLLDLARASSGPKSLKKEWLPIEETIGSSLRLLETKLSAFKIKTDLQRDMPLLDIDPVLIERVVCNVLENAANHSSAGSVIDIRAFTESGKAILSVRDHGIGFSSNQITDYGQELQDRGVPRLGLVICRSILNAHNGDLLLGNHPDGGALVQISLPLGNPPEITETD